MIPMILKINEMTLLKPNFCKLTINDMQIFGILIKTIVKGMSNKNVLP
jgi:hypothetical protein